MQVWMRPLRGRVGSWVDVAPGYAMGMLRIPRICCTPAGESDEDGDGFFETVMIMDDSTGEFEQYIKEKDGSVRPLESEKLLELYQKKYEADMLLQKMIDDAR